jgi:hypothetical protein
VSNHEVMDGPEHQIRLSKGVIAKFVQPLELAPTSLRESLGDVGHPVFSGNAKSHRDGGFCVSVLWLEVDLYFKVSKLDGVIWQVFAICAQLGSVSGFAHERGDGSRSRNPCRPGWVVTASLR